MKVNFVVTPILFLIFSSGCLNSSRKSLSLTLQEKKVAALDNIPIGMPENEAFKIMQQIGFTCACEKKENSTLSYYANSDDISLTKLRNVDFLNCYSSESKWTVTSYLDVKLLMKEKKVAKKFIVWQFDGL